MKKLLSLVLALAMALSLAACGSKTESPAPSTGNQSNTSDPAVHLTVVSAGNTPDNAISKGYDKFAELVKEYSGGNITADVY